MTVRSKNPTLEEFLQWPEQKPYLEFIHGEVRPKVPDASHGIVQARLSFYLVPWSESNQGWTMTEQRCILEANGEIEVVLPDVAWWSSTQLPSAPSGPLRIPPTLAIEILSPNDRYGEVQDKVLFYLQAGVAIVWVVDTRTFNVTIYRPGRPPELVKSPAPLQDDMLPGLIVPLADVFARLPLTDDPQPRIQE